jgi:hypothetical protein
MTALDLTTPYFHLVLQIDAGTLTVLVQALVPFLADRQRSRHNSSGA